MVPSDMDDLQVPGVGSVAETLPCIQHLCNHMKEARPACTRVATRLQNLQQELRRMSEEGHPPALESLAGYVEVFANFLQLLRKYHNKHLIFRVAEHQKMTERLKQVNEQLAQVFAALDVGAPTNWDTSWQIDCRLQEQALTNAVDKSDIRSLQSSRAQLEALLTLKFEVEKRADRHDGMSMILIQSLMGKISAEMKRTEVTLPPWFLPLYEVEVEAEPFAGGHFGKVHRGVMRSGEKVVVEFFSVDELVTDERAQVQVEKELGRLFQLRHSNVVTMLGGSHVSTPPFVVYEDTDNGNLGCFLARSDNKKKIWTMLHEAALGLDYLHKKGFTHGHLKLSNILVGTDGQAKLADVGLNAMRRYSALSKKFPDAVAKDDLRWRAPECLVKGPTTTSDVPF
ncbi:hypothetical protein PF002_g27170 [Phytophthora fragariae]|uniref:Protein kinase domain-containing protein n=1 Tax=Phytophthora fragariae TaxID=53985 RepID=A0A6A3DIT3_9STRA|nr:hypothetical protein PF003_g1991 [Phytophthora fragariae]KAE8921752.1 hypothetical protein PF009_g27974 [Phytophthora fragariae]KAE9083606.1 hypothetical protein PF006_g26658 [Phytophthora fragariae]KAE9181808.1 hypothetical protein PF002_g27170 [Phytophthora fragariae]KAE9275468.1 hypothetical protein PF001_g26571 [Phytophthora fragariae]